MIICHLFIKTNIHNRYYLPTIFNDVYHMQIFEKIYVFKYCLYHFSINTIGILFEWNGGSILLEKICHAIKTRNYSCTYSMEVIKAKKMIKISSIIKFYLLFSFQRWWYTPTKYDCISTNVYITLIQNS